MNINIREIKVHKDERGWLAELLRKEDVGGDFGQVYLTTAYPNVVKANHYHKIKTEWMCVIKGEAKLVLCEVFTRKTAELILSDQNLRAIKVLPNIAHCIKNIGKEMMYLLIYSDMVFDPENPDTFEYRCII